MLHGLALYTPSIRRVSRGTRSPRLFLGIGLDCIRKEIAPAGPALKAENPLWVLWACELFPALVEMEQVRPGEECPDARLGVNTVIGVDRPHHFVVTVVVERPDELDKDTKRALEDTLRALIDARRVARS